MITTVLQIPVTCGKEKEVELLFENRKELFEKVEGFESLEVLKPLGNSDYLVISKWKTQKSLADWLNSKNFKSAHMKSLMPEFMSGRPKFNIFESI